MKCIWIITVLFLLSGCGTFGGAVRGLGSDLDLVGSYITDFWFQFFFDPKLCFDRIKYKRNNGSVKWHTK